METDHDGNVARVLITDLSTNGTYINAEKIGKGNSLELKHGAELSLGVKSSSAAKKSGSNKGPHTFVSFIFKSSTGGGEESDVHEAFTEEGGPGTSYQCSKVLVFFFFYFKN